MVLKQLLILISGAIYVNLCGNGGVYFPKLPFHNPSTIIWEVNEVILWQFKGQLCPNYCGVTLIIIIVQLCLVKRIEVDWLSSNKAQKLLFQFLLHCYTEGKCSINGAMIMIMMNRANVEKIGMSTKLLYVFVIDHAQE